MKVYGALELAQLEWFTNATKPAAASFIYRVIYVSDLKQIQVSDGTNWIPFLNTSTNQTLSGDITFSGQQIFNGLHRLSVTTNSATGAIVALAPTTPITEFTGAVTSVSGITSGASGATVMLINRSGSPFTVLDEDTSATAGNRIRTGTGSSITLTNNASILLSYAGDSRWHVVGGTGSSSAGGAKNYFVTSSANSNFSQNSVSPWSACTLTFSSGVPSGAPTLTATQMAISASATNPLVASQSSYNLLLTKSAANAQYQGFISGELTIDREDLAKVLTGSFSYEVASGTVDFSGTSTQSLEIWVYNTVSGAWTQPAGYRGMNTSSGTGVVSFTFQTDSTAANNKYKIAVITQQTSATGYTVNFNDFSVGPTVVVNGTPVTDWQSYTPTFTGFGTVSTQTFWWRRNGDTVQIKGRFAAGTSTATEARISLPFSLVSDSSKVNGTAEVCGVAQPSDVNSSTTGGIGATFNVLIEPSLGYVTFASRTSTNGGLTKINANSMATGGTSLSLFAQIPVQGWSSNVQISSDTDTRVVVARAQRTTTQSLSNSAATKVQFDLVNEDTHGSFDSTTNYRYTIPVSGRYVFSGSLACLFSANNGVLFANLYVDGSSVDVRGLNHTTNATNANAYMNFSFERNLNAGQYVEIFATQTNSGAGSLNLRGNDLVTGASSFIITRLSGPSVVAATETVALKRSSISGAQINSSVTTYVDFPNAEIDTHNAWVPSSGAYNPATGTWSTQNPVYRVPVSGVYLMTATVGFQNAAFASAYNCITLFKNATGFADGSNAGSATSTQYQTTASGIVRCNAGDLLGVFVFQDTGGARNLQNFGLPRTQISIVRVGN